MEDVHCYAHAHQFLVFGYLQIGSAAASLLVPILAQSLYSLTVRRKAYDKSIDH